MTRKRARSLDSEQWLESTSASQRHLTLARLTSTAQHQLANRTLARRLAAFEKGELARHEGIMALLQELRHPNPPQWKRLKATEGSATTTTDATNTDATTTDATTSTAVPISLSNSLQPTLRNVSASLVPLDRQFQLLAPDLLFSSNEQSSTPLRSTMYEIIVQVLNCILAEATVADKGTLPSLECR
ncbi:hypothetical protein NA57DRAFT_52779 [Rhizodiscina lignyota]|uniref:Uncharacterized protein n=1 Tax=Rhizodiscina lignyota TaxID=1504668 RepID=A0A9P4IKJ1_9PEZI|nr:hypothetical protein NA57DRAFT_52779 [Rhizodiscina lignyota]